MDWLAGLADTATPFPEIVLRLGLAVLLGMCIGIDRELRNRPAGLRTHMLVSLATASFTVITFELFASLQERAAEDGTAADPLRIIEAVTAGVAFLAAGTIIQARGRVSGLTTGASIWLVGATGLACGGGFYAIAVLVTLLALLILYLLKIVEDRSKRDGTDRLRDD